MTLTPDFLDGNAAAGDLESLFGTDMTMATGRCHGCGEQMALAQTHAYLDGPGMVLRCPGCDGVLLRLVRSPAEMWLDASGLDYLKIPTPA
ncbi:MULTISPECIES: DUF6510 family protein [Streptomyces]|uniref:Transcription factor zinc-finger domain-containing protein n=1 Tax=Streptomyces dengpaensis TaxID=2049881 RepID=A0ABM6SJC0_9ACTN|nr:MULTISPECIES: DUF6510 family protein [Streptomyces]AVH54744.1 hypothetical protein C4B68_01750 [Streptomyces dengpaensis]PIB03846.1 hypothetical protein B1C81_35680 [Streptomyces sp. HG99]